MTVLVVCPSESTQLFDLLDRQKQGRGFLCGGAAGDSRHHHELSETCNQRDEQTGRNDRFYQHNAIPAVRRLALDLRRHAPSRLCNMQSRRFVSAEA